MMQQPPMPSDPQAVPCPHCGAPVSIQKHAMGPMEKPVLAKGHAKPMKKKNAATMPVDELKEMLKSQKPKDGPDGNE